MNRSYTQHGPVKDATGSVPLGNGDISLNAWIDHSGDICAYVGKSDSWGEFGQLYKVGLIRVRLLDKKKSPLLLVSDFEWSLDFQCATLNVRSASCQLKIFVDANDPCIRLSANMPSGCSAILSFEPWRQKQRALQGKERHGLHTHAPYPVWNGEDVLPDLTGEQIACFHNNKTSSWGRTLEQQGLGHLTSVEEDPLLGRTFGLLARGIGAVRQSSSSLLAAQLETVEFSVVVLTSKVESPGDWICEAEKIADACGPEHNAASVAAHDQWWQNFWQRSFIRIEGNEAGRKVAFGYEVQRYLNACAGRGAQPIKFNGSLFTVDWRYPGEDFDADYRRWGPGYWHQNTRLPYWAMLYAGDFDLMLPYFQMYKKALPLARERCRKFCGHQGAFFPETMSFWGSYLDHNYGWINHPQSDPSGNIRRDPDLPGHLPQNQYIRRHFSGSLEVVFLALLYHRFTQDDAFLAETALPLAKEIINFYDLHYPRDNGRLRIHPAQVIEQWWSAENPMPEIAGLHACVNAVLKLPATKIDNDLRAQCQRLQKELPDLPVRDGKNGKLLAPADIWDDQPHNQENPELYAVFPYLHCSPQSDLLEAARKTFRERTYTHDIGWAQDGMQAALLGLANEARDSVIQRLTTPSPYARFPGFWGPGWDWIPDQDQGGSATHALQLMAFQAYENNVYSFPAWPEEWEAEICLHGPFQNRFSLHHAPDRDPAVEVEGNPREINLFH